MNDFDDIPGEDDIQFKAPYVEGGVGSLNELITEQRGYEAVGGKINGTAHYKGGSLSRTKPPEGKRGNQ